MKERIENFDIFIERMKNQNTVYYDFDRHVLSIYEGQKTDHEEMEEDEVNWLEINDRALYYLTQKIGLNASEGVNLIIALAAYGKNVVVKNFNPGNIAVWENLQEKSDDYSSDFDGTPGEIIFESKDEEELSEQEQREKRFLEEFPNKPTIYYDTDYCQLFIYLGEGSPLEEMTESKDWTTFFDWQFNKVIGYSAFGSIDHILALSAMGYDLEVIQKERSKFSEVLEEEFELFVEHFPENIDLADEPGNINYHYRDENPDLDIYFLLKKSS